MLKALNITICLALILFNPLVYAENMQKTVQQQKTIKVTKGHSYPLKLAQDVDTVAIGDPNVIQVATIKPNLIMISGQTAGSTSLSVFTKDDAVVTYIVQVTNDATQLKSLIGQLERNVIVDEIGDVIVLKGTVKTAAALTRVLSLAERFVSNAAKPDFSVISDKGGVLAGNTEETDENDPELLNLGIQQVAVGGGRGAGAGRAGRNGLAGLRQSFHPNKGNIAQNIARGDVIMVAGGKVMSLIKVEAQQKVEIQMRIVAVDRNKTDEFGWDWTLNGDLVNGGKSTGVTLSSALGANNGRVTRNANNPRSGTFEPGGATLTTLFNLTDKKNGVLLDLVSFLRMVEEKGAGTTLSEPLITAISGETARFLVGGTIPIPVQTLAAGSATQNAVAVTNVNFIPYGLNLVVRPTVLENGSISIVLDQSISEPDYTNAITILSTPIPSFIQKSVSTITESESGETWAVAGLLTEEDTKKLSEIPFFSDIPIIGQLFKKKNDKASRNELFIVVKARTLDTSNDTTQNFDNAGSLKPDEDHSLNDDQESITKPEGNDANKKVQDKAVIEKKKPQPVKKKEGKKDFPNQPLELSRHLKQGYLENKLAKQIYAVNIRHTLQMDDNLPTKSDEFSFKGICNQAVNAQCSVMQG